MIGRLWTCPAGMRVHRVQRVVVAASPQIKKGGAAPPRVV